MKKIFVLFFIIFQVNAQDCFPESDQRYSYKKKNSGLSEFDTQRVIDHFQKTMSQSVLVQLGKKLIVSLDWKEDRVNASASRDDDNNPTIAVYGGMARHPEMNRDALYLILCHELGHHLGGAPKKFRGRSTKLSWSSVEGQADYYATSKCLPKIFSQFQDTSIPSKSFSEDEYQYSQERCSDELICYRSAAAALSVGRLFASLKNSSQKLSLSLKDRTIVSSTTQGHPNPQCRIDTFMAGFFCSELTDRHFDNNDPLLGACSRDEIPKSNMSESPSRPFCWYFPNI